MRLKKVNIILSVYEGEKYLRELLDSLFEQTYGNIEIFARDDNSKDSSFEILKEYSKKRKKGIKFTLVPTGKGAWKYPACFWDLLKIAKNGDYFFWCDQDDVWLPNKVEQAVEKFNELPPDVPAAHIGAHYFCDSNLKIKYLVKPPKDTSLTNVIYNAWMLGFDLSFNKALYDMLFRYEILSTSNHDYWTAYVAASTGVILRSDEPSIKYRRNDGAMTSMNQSQIRFYLWRIKRFLFTNKYLDSLKNDVKLARRIYDDQLSDENRKMLEIFAVDNFPNRLKRVFYPHRMRNTWMDELALRALFVMGKL